MYQDILDSDIMLVKQNNLSCAHRLGIIPRVLEILYSGGILCI